MKRRLIFAYLLGGLSAFAQSGKSKLERAFAVRAKQQSAESLADLKRLGPGALEIWDRSAPSVLSKLPSIPNLVMVEMQETMDGAGLTFSLVDVDGVQCTLWCDWEGRKFQGRTIRYLIRAISPY